MTTLLIKLIQIIHFIILLFIVFGFLFNSNSILLIHITLIPLIIIQWKLNSGRCYLTDLEAFLKNKSGDFMPNNESEGFVSNLFIKVFKKPLTDKQLMFILYGVMTLSGFASIYKLMN